MFPQAMPSERDGDFARDDAGNEDSPSPDKAAADYPLRWAMRLVVKLTEYQGVRTPAEWERWANRLDELLEAVTEPESEMIAALRLCGIDPLSALLEPMFQPADLSAKQRNRLIPVIARIRKLWELDQCASLVPGKGGWGSICRPFSMRSGGARQRQAAFRWPCCLDSAWAIWSSAP